MSRDPREDTWNLLDNFDPADPSSTDEWIQQKQVHFEELVVKHVLDHYKIRGELATIRSMSRELSGSAQITLEWFRSLYLDFPVCLGARDVYKAHEVTLEDLEKRFTNTKIFHAYQDLLETTAEEDFHTLGLVYRPRGVLTILHNYINSLDYPGFRLVRALKKGQVYVIEKFSQFLENLPWQPS